MPRSGAFSVDSGSISVYKSNVKRLEVAVQPRWAFAGRSIAQSPKIYLMDSISGGRRIESDSETMVEATLIFNQEGKNTGRLVSLTQSNTALKFKVSATTNSSVVQITDHAPIFNITGGNFIIINDGSRNDTYEIVTTAADTNSNSKLDHPLISNFRLETDTKICFNSKSQLQKN